MNTAEKWHGTTIVLLRKNGETVVAGDGQVSLGNTVLKSKAKKVRKIESRGVVIEVEPSMADYVLQTLAHPFHNDYSDVTFIPFTKTDTEYSETLRQVMIAQNTMLHETKRKILHGLNIFHLCFAILSLE